MDFLIDDVQDETATRSVVGRQSGYWVASTGYHDRAEDCWKMEIN